MNYAPVHEPKPWEEPTYKNIDSGDDTDSDVEDEEKQSNIDDSEVDRNFSDVETSSVGESDISEHDVTVINLFKNRMKKSHPNVFKTVLQEEEFFPE